MFYKTLFCLVLAALAISCSAPATALPVRVPTTNATTNPGIATISFIASVKPEKLYPNETLTVRLNFEPIVFKSGKTADGVAYSSQQHDPNPRVHEMRVCVQMDSRCELNGAWIPFEKKFNTTLPIDWLGKRDLWVNVEFRDNAGNKIAHLGEIQNIPLSPLTVESILDTRTPMASQPAFVQTQVAVTRVAFPVTGSIEIQNGMCCAGGKVNATIELTADFSANSSEGIVTEMRMLNQCVTPPEMERATWEPFVVQKKFPFKISVANWVGWYLAVQYRDDKGNLSPVYCDDISIEGMQ